MYHVEPTNGRRPPPKPRTSESAPAPPRKEFPFTFATGSAAHDHISLEREDLQPQTVVMGSALLVWCVHALTDLQITSPSLMAA